MTKGTPALTGICNLLVSRDNVLLGGLGRTMTDKFGNWVGGSYELDDNAFRFTMNGLNKLFQRNTDQIMIPRSAVRHVSKGKMFGFFATVDLETEFGQFRIRATPRGTRALLAAFGAD